MVDQINKTLLRMSEKERLHIKKVVAMIVRGNLQGLDVKKLKGYDNAYRVREGVWRIIFRITSPDEAEVISITRRSESTYR